MAVPARPGWLRTLLLLELAVLLAAVAGLALLRSQAVAAELSALSAFARAMALLADDKLGVADAVLRATREELSRRLIVPGTPEADAVLRARLLPLAGFVAISVFDDQGRRIASTRPAGTPAPLAVAARDFFVAARAARTPTLVIGTPYEALADGHPAISLAMNWHDEDGRFRGVVALVGPPDVLDGDFARGVAGPDTRVDVHRLDGSVLNPRAATGGAGPALPAEQVRALRVLAAPVVARALPGADGSRPLAAAAALGRYPLTAVVSRDARQVLARWRELAWLVGGWVLATLALALGLGLWVAREQGRRQALERRLERARKLESLGKLAGGVAHDVNNVLAAVIGYGELARLAAPDGSRQAQQLDQVLQAGERGRQVVQRLLAAGRGQPRRRQPIALQPLIEEVLAHLVAGHGPAPRIACTLPPQPVVVRADATALYEALMNLCSNAVQAMPGGGLLAVRLSEQLATRPQALYDSLLPPGRWARIEVEDAGSGMTPAVMARLFEPFFSTKPPGDGTGLGLAVVHGVVSDHGGAIDVASTPGRGSRFTLYLPRVAEAALPASAAAPTAELPRGRGERVLVVDDEPALVTLVEELLAELGYEPFGLSDPVRARDELRADPARFDLLLSDERMPGLSGSALAAEARALRPGLPVVLVSGHAGALGAAGEADDARPDGAANVDERLAKPLTRADLAHALRRALDAPRAPAGPPAQDGAASA
ncbi:ATP-binding protein [Piscinibacter sakaiensis]|uniref:histidine kinase n=1 Tax=Piscinibacter sakaiensis TaxID=1547922 RepID=A0A0K8P4W8_PISS1|nr:ATP-binding protein [Piscinibacter sakaiensis]GAP37195.1 hypothetical protein ISF6_3050 [Piscinibacter sakaiensis]